MNITINITESIKRVQEFQEYDLGQITTTLQDLLDNSSITVDSNIIPILKILSIDDIVKKYLIKNLTENIYNTSDYITGQDLTENDLLLITGDNQTSGTTVNTAFVNKAYLATMTVAHDAINPNFETDLVGNLDLTVTGTENGDSGLVNLYFSDTETATINGVKSLSITGDGEMIPVYFIHDTDGIKWYDAREAINPDLTSIQTQIDDKANQDGTILYHTLKWFTPSGTVSSVGTTVTSVGTQFTSYMVGAKLIINGEERIITVYTSNTTVTVDSAYSTNYIGVVSGSWGVYSKAYEVTTFGTTVIYTYVGQLNLRVDTNNFTGCGTLSALNNNYILGVTGLDLRSDHAIRSSSTTSHSGTKDVGIRRNSAGVYEIYDGVTATGLEANRRDLLVRNIISKSNIYADDAAADADATLPSGALYKITGSRAIFQKP